MNHEEKIRLLANDVQGWNKWRREYSIRSPFLNKANLEFLDLREANLVGASLRDANLKNADLRDANLRNVDLRSAELEGTDLRGANLTGVYLKAARIDKNTEINEKWVLIRDLLTRGGQGTTLANLDFSGANMNSIDLQDADLRGANLRGANLEHAHLEGTDLRGSDLTGANLKGAYLKNIRIDRNTKIGRKWKLVRLLLSGKSKNGATQKINFCGEDLSGANLKDANLKLLDLSGVNLSSAVLRTASLHGADLTNAVFYETDIRGADLSNVELKGACLKKTQMDDSTKIDEKWRLVRDLLSEENITVSLAGKDLSNAYLVDVDFSKINLNSADLCNGNLSGSNFSGVDLGKANLKDSNLSGCNLSNTDCQNANFSRANLSQADLNGSIMHSARLNDANLSKIQALGTSFKSATLTGICIQDWNINSDTDFQDVICKYIYLREDGKSQEERERRPHDPQQDFENEDFSKLVKKVRNTIDLIFRNGINWEAFSYSIDRLQVVSNTTTLSVQKIEAKDNGDFIIQVNSPPELDKTEIYRFIQKEYKKAERLMEQHLHKLEDSNKKLSIQHNNNSVNILEFIKTVARQAPIQMQYIRNQENHIQTHNDSSVRIGGNVDNCIIQTADKNTAVLQEIRPGESLGNSK